MTKLSHTNLACRASKKFPHFTTMKQRCILFSTTLSLLTKDIVGIRGEKKEKSIPSTTEEIGSNKIQFSSVEDVGRIHYSVIDNLMNTFDGKTEILYLSHDDLLSALHDELYNSFCSQGDSECETDLHHQINHGRSLVRSFNSHSKAYFEDTELFETTSYSDHIHSYIRSHLPEEFDPEVEKSLRSMITTLDLIGTHTLNENSENSAKHINQDENTIPQKDIIHMLNEHMQVLKENESVQDESHRAVGVAALSVAIESTKQWMEVYSDPDHVFIQMCEQMLLNSDQYGREILKVWESDLDVHNRRLQTGNFPIVYTDGQGADGAVDPIILDLSPANTGQIISRDVLGAIVGILDNIWRPSWRRRLSDESITSHTQHNSDEDITQKNHRTLKSGKGLGVGGGGRLGGVSEKFYFSPSAIVGSSGLAIVTSVVAFFGTEWADFINRSTTEAPQKGFIW